MECFSPYIQSFVSVCDLLIVFSPNLGESNPLLKPVVFDVEPKLTMHLSDFLMCKVFVEDYDGNFISLVTTGLV